MNYRQREVMSALDWIRMARDVALTVDGYKANAIVSRLDQARERICSALDIVPDEVAIETVVSAARETA